MLADKPEDIVPIEHAPDGGERVAQAEVDAAKPAARRHRPRRHHRAGEVRVDQPFQRLERTAELLAIPRLAHLPADAGQVIRRDARHLVHRHLDPLPVVAAVGPGVIEEAAPAVRRRQADLAAIVQRQHRTDRLVDIVRHARRLVEDQEMDVGVAADRLLLAGQAGDQAPVLEVDLVHRPPLDEMHAAGAEIIRGDAEEQARLPQAGGHHQHARAGDADRFQDAQERHRRALARLPAAIEQEPLLFADQHIELPGIGLEPERMHGAQGAFEQDFSVVACHGMLPNLVIGH